MREGKLSNRQKKYFTIAGCMLFGLGLMAAIGNQFREVPGKKDVLAQRGTLGKQIFVAELEMDKEEASGTEITIKPEGMDSGKMESLPPQTDKEEQKLMAEVTKEEVSEEILHDPTRKPDGEEIVGTPEATVHEEVRKPEREPVKKGEPQAGDTSGGQIYIPGFGWVGNEGGGASGKTAGDMYENGNKIGIMN